jgi:hypothetical protein
MDLKKLEEHACSLPSEEFKKLRAWVGITP